MRDPTATASAKTDADGKFAAKLKPGRYAVVAASNRLVVGDTETYRWVLWHTVRRGADNKLMLSNDNLYETSCVDCVRLEDAQARPATAKTANQAVAPPSRYAPPLASTHKPHAVARSLSALNFIVSDGRVPSAGTGRLGSGWPKGRPERQFGG
jgi:hypothetical protein